MIPIYTSLGGNRYLADFGGGRTVEVEQTRERAWPGLEWGEVHRPLYEHAASLIPWGSEVLDVGCGSGYGTRILRDAGGYAEGSDVDRSAVEFATFHVPGTRFFRTDIALSAGERTYGAVVCVEAIEHVEDDLNAMRAMSAALRSGGMLYLTTPERDDSRGMSPFHAREYTWSELVALLEAAGFGNIKRHRVTAFLESMVVTAEVA